ncbi:Hsp70 family protein [Aliikangiella marina]|uniref:Hsp70 family protein n=1 Tax=Aliikangiella marina TaxID=1712262 RepID=A0A545TC39_9GAMM|nr:Hsp70 family protein [Aliikangiella marina]TQV74788.1 Hsp70 family protein [Aliikangiella marina]
MYRLGIDLGTTNTLAAYVNNNNTPELIPDPRFSDVYITPSVVHVSANACVAGESLERILAANNQLSVTRNIKLSMGQDRSVFTHTDQSNWTPEAISSLLLKKVKKDAELKLGTQISEALVAIPANFDSSQRLATQAASKMAGFSKVELVEEPVAAAASYCFSSDQKEQTIFVYDLGGGTFDATVIHSSADGLYTLSTIGSKTIGGKYFDELIVNELIQLYKATFGTSRFSTGALEVLRQFAEESKAKLSTRKMPTIRQSLLIDGNVLDVCFTYQHLSKLVYPLLDQTMELSHKCVQDAGLNWQQIDSILLVGGSSQLQAVTDKLHKLTGKDKESLILYQPHEAIAFGAAILANGAHSESGQQFELKQQIASNYLGLSTYNPETKETDIEFLIERNTPLPTTVSKTFYTNRRHQEKMSIELLQAKQGKEDAERLGVFSFGPFANEQDNVPIDFEITYGRDGIIKVEAIEKEKQVKLSGIANVENNKKLDTELNIESIGFI